MAQAFSIQQIENSNGQVDRCGCTTSIEVSGINSGSSSLVLKFLSIPEAERILGTRLQVDPVGVLARFIVLFF